MPPLPLFAGEGWGGGAATGSESVVGTPTRRASRVDPRVKPEGRLSPASGRGAPSKPDNPKSNNSATLGLSYRTYSAIAVSECGYSVFGTRSRSLSNGGELPLFAGEGWRGLSLLVR
jgi:hypothetical protein